MIVSSWVRERRYTPGRPAPRDFDIRAKKGGMHGTDSDLPLRSRSTLVALRAMIRYGRTKAAVSDHDMTMRRRLLLLMLLGWDAGVAWAQPELEFFEKKIR